MSGIYFYLSLIPETLVASMLPPEEFGRYLAAGTQKRTHAEAMYFSIKPGFRNEDFNWERAEKSCVAHQDGSPKHTVYASIYRVLEHIPLAALGELYLATRDARVLPIKQAPVPDAFTDSHYLYNEICPVHPLIASKLNPVEFSNFITDPATTIWLPRVCFVQLNPDVFIRASEGGSPSHPLDYLPDRVAECFSELDRTNKRTKTVDRTHQLTCGWRHVRNGYFVGDKTGLLYYPFPSRDELATHHHDWLRSALL